MDKEKTKKNIEKIFIITHDFCDRKPIYECTPSDCILNSGCGKNCIFRTLRYINVTLRKF